MAVVGIEIAREGEGGGCWCTTVPAVLQYRGYCSRGGGCEGERAAARVGGAGNAGRGAWQERRDFLLISCLIRLIHLLSLYREVYLTPKQATN